MPLPSIQSSTCSEIARRYGIENRAKEFKMATDLIQSFTSRIKK
jgi:hypothetical protein